MALGQVLGQVLELGQGQALFVLLQVVVQLLGLVAPEPLVIARSTSLELQVVTAGELPLMPDKVKKGKQDEECGA